MRSLKPYFLFLGLTLVNVCGAQVTPYYHRDLAPKPAEFNLQSGPATNLSNAEMTDIVKGEAVKIDTNGTYAIERQAVVFGHQSPGDAWTAAINFYGGQEQFHPGKTFDNVGWIRRVRSINGTWSAYLWTLQNRIAFRSSATNRWEVKPGVRVPIIKVIVGTLGDYPPMTNVVDIGPDISMATNAFPDVDKGDEGVFQVDLTNVYYQLEIPIVRIKPLKATAAVGDTNLVRFTATGTNIPNGVTWTINPSTAAGGAVLRSSGDWRRVDAAPGNVATNYKVRATSVDNTNFHAEADLEVLKVDIVESNVYCGASNTAVLHLTPDSSPKVKWEIIPEIQHGAYIKGGDSGTSLVINAGSIATNYTVKAHAFDLTECRDKANLKVITAEMSVDNNRNGRITFDASDRTSQDQPFIFWINNDCDSGSGDDPDGKKPNYSDKVINGIRDLEDFTRIHIDVSGILSDLKKSQIQLALKFKNTKGNPAINLWKAMDDQGGEGYLTDVNIAQRHLDLTSPGYITSGRGYTIAQKFWDELANGNKIAHFLFEGAGAGKGELALQVIKDGKVVYETQSVWMDLKDIKAMYERAKATPETIEPPYNVAYPHDDPPEPDMGWAPDPNGHPFEPDWGEETQNRSYIVFVHGWNMSYNDSLNYAETMFKRLWWRGYKGRFAFFRWPTSWNQSTFTLAANAYLGRYNEGEYIAWKSGSSLRQFVNSLPAGYARNIAAHSMGNIVVGSALQQGMTVANYALLQAAVPACCYDIRPELDQAPRHGLFGRKYWNTPTPDNDPDQATRALAYRGQIRKATGNLINFFLPQDQATARAWEFNNDRFKPCNPGGSSKYYYDINAPSGRKLGLGFMWTVGRFVRTPHEAMAFVDQSPTKAVGAEERARGMIARTFDLSVPFFGSQNGFGDEHNAEFSRNIQELQSFYRTLLNQLNEKEQP